MAKRRLARFVRGRGPMEGDQQQPPGEAAGYVEDTEAGVLLYARVVAAYESESAEKPCSLAVGDVVAVVDEKATGWCALSPCAIQ